MVNTTALRLRRHPSPTTRARLLLLLAVMPLLFILAACGGGNGPYLETFDDPGDWSTGNDTYSEGQVVDGVYDLLIKGEDVSRWASAAREFGDGVYQVEATQVEGPIDNGYGMLFRADPDAGDFYLFKVSGDGFVWIGRYVDGVESEAIVGEHWFASPAVRQGTGVTNVLRVRAESGNLIFYVNDQEVGRVTDNSFASGDIGVFAQTLGFPGVRVHFDNFSVTPLADAEPLVE